MKRLLTSLLTAIVLLIPPVSANNLTLLNVSYDATREFYTEYNALFIAHWKQQTGQDVHIAQSHAGSSSQATAVINGLQADILTLALAYDIDVIAADTKLLPLDWQKAFPNNSCPYTSTIVFLVKKGNPKHIHDWDDLVKDGIQVITANPKTSGVARWNYLAAYGYALQKNNQDPEKAKAFVKKLFANVPILDTSSRN